MRNGSATWLGYAPCFLMVQFDVSWPFCTKRNQFSQSGSRPWAHYILRFTKGNCYTPATGFYCAHQWSLDDHSELGYWVQRYSDKGFRVIAKI